jgi:hypothetical protein
MWRARSCVGWRVNSARVLADFETLYSRHRTSEKLRIAAEQGDRRAFS